jgi:exopolysaccharide production protein ExoQ
MKNRRTSAYRIAEVVLLIVMPVAASLRGLPLSKLIHPLQLEIEEGLMDIVLAIAAVLLLWGIGRLHSFFSIWKKAWPLLFFSAVALVSLSWSVDPMASSFRLLILMGSSVFAGYMAVRYSLREVVVICAWYFVVMAVLSVLIALSVPGMGTMEVPPYNGAWNGIFWHRNYLGSMMALGSVVLLAAAVSDFRDQRIRALIYLVGYVLNCILVWQSRSATGMILLLILQACLVVAFAWIRWHTYLQRKHYWMIGIGLLAMIVAALFNLDLLLGFFGRNSTFTGRVALWQYLWESTGSQRPWLGHGLGTLWTSPEFQRSVRDVLGWPYPVYIGDNVYMDVLLQLGYIGLTALVLVLSWASCYSIRVLLNERRIISAVPAIVLIYMLLTNYTLSYFLETESLTWLIFLACVFAAQESVRYYGRAVRISTASVLYTVV